MKSFLLSFTNHVGSECEPGVKTVNGTVNGPSEREGVFGALHFCIKPFGRYCRPFIVIKFLICKRLASLETRDLATPSSLAISEALVRPS